MRARPVPSILLAGALLAAAAPAAHATWKPIASWESPSPEAVAVDPTGDVFVTAAPAGGDNDGVVRYSAGGKLLKRWGVTGQEPGQIDSPFGIATDPQGRIYITDITARLQVFDRDGAYLGGSPVTVPTGEPVIAFDVDVDATGERFVTHNGDSFAGIAPGVLRYGADGTQLASWGAAGAGDGQFETPRAVASDGRGNVYVADPDNNRIQRFTSAGAFVRGWGQLGTGPGQFGFPSGIAVDAAGDVFVADKDNDRVQHFRPDGTFVEQFAVPSVSADDPSDLDFAPNGDLVVATSSRAVSAKVFVFRQPAAGAAVSAKRLRVRGGRIPVALRCTASSTCRGTVRVAAGKRVIGSRAYSVAPGKTATVKVKPTRAGRAAIRRTQKVSVRLTPRNGAASTVRLTLRR